MEPKAPQFSAYDFLGYLLPGLVLIGLIDCSWHYHSNQSSVTWDFVLKRYSELSWNNAIPLALFGYFFGHMVSFASSIIIEGHATRVHGHPSSFLVKATRPLYFHSGRWESGRYIAIVGIVILKAAVLVFMLPICWIEFLFTHVLGFSKRINAPVKPILRMCIAAAEDRLLDALDVKNRSGRRPKRRNDELHWGNGLERLALHYALEMAPAHLFTLRNYVVLYGFLRAMTLILLVVVWMVALHFFIEGNLCRGFSVLFVGGALILPSYAAFLKFWARYHREALMAFLAAMAKQAEPKSKTASEEV